MELKKEVIGDHVLCIRLTGHVDAVVAPQLEKEIVAALAAPHSRCLLDLAGVEYMSSAGLRVLVVGAKAAESVNGAFAVCSLQGAVYRVLAAVGFFSCIVVYENQSEAVLAINKPPDKK